MTTSLDAFDFALTRVLASEGGYVNNSADPGGATNYGITQATARAHGYTGNMQDFPLELAKQIYRASYWDRYNLGALPRNLAFVTFDAVVNSGPAGIIWMQRALKVTEDGIIGPQTVAAAKMADDYACAVQASAYRLRALTAMNNWATFGRGWARRIANNLQQLQEA